MTTSNHPENLNTDEAHDLGQISTKPAKPDYPAWVVVEHPGTDDENIVIDFYTAREAYRYIERNYTEDECDVDVMKRREDGVLTTEF